MRFKQYIPGFVEGLEPEEFEFNNIEELLNHPLIAKAKDMPGFFRYSISKQMLKPKHDILMAEFNEGKEWFVLGYIDDAKNIDLPEWQPKEAQNEQTK